MSSSKYCEWDYCSVSQYCCGDNECCENTTTTWILICGLLSSLAVISICFGFCYRHFDYYRLRRLCPFSSRDQLIPDTAKSKQRVLDINEI